MSMGEVPRSIRGWGLFAADTSYLVPSSVSRWSINLFYDMISQHFRKESLTPLLPSLLIQTNMPHQSLCLPCISVRFVGPQSEHACSLVRLVLRNELQDTCMAGGWSWLAKVTSVLLQSLRHDLSLPSNEAINL